MTLHIDEIEHTFFRFLADELSVSEFEQWIYSNSELERYLDEPAYLEFISFNFRQPAVNYELSKLIYQSIPQARFDNWQIKRLLKNLYDETQDPVVIFKKIYYMYDRGYYFLSNIGIQYLLGIDEIPQLTEQSHWDENEFFHRRKMLDQYLEPIRDEVEILLQALETGEIKLFDENEYFITPDLSEKLKDLPRTSHPEAHKQPKKAWWKFWKTENRA